MALRIAIVGAESTGKTTLAAELAAHLDHATGLRATWVPEVLRGWCQSAGRTPRVHEQASILRAQSDAIEQAAAHHSIVVCDTTAVMTAVYSRLVFNDRSLEERAVALHRRMGVTLLTALDLPWVADGLQRDGPHVQASVDALLRELLGAHRLPFSVIGGDGPSRLQRALDAVMPALPIAAALGTGLFSRLKRRSGSKPDAVSSASDDAAASSALRPACECCSVAECEQVLRRR